MPSIYDVPADELIKRTALELKKRPEIKPPVWSAFVKTGVHKERPPMIPDWWHVRVAAVLRSIDRLGPIGVSKLRTKYGGKMHRGHKREHFYKGSGSIIRKVLQQLEAAKLIKQTKIGIHKGRVLTPEGHSLLDKAALVIHKERKTSTKQEKPVSEPPETKQTTAKVKEAVVE
ncbi:30S ribosomal protein S19e [Candidatus Woesearchaeota archaeon]|nr:30S ribosomal protein S19e [Candidatus Woesearchaeota archaeon]